MRIAGLVLGSLLLVLAVGGYLQFARSLRSDAPEFREQIAAGEFFVELTPTFAAQPGVFSRLEPLTAELRLHGRAIWESSEALLPGQPVMVPGVKGFVVGRNELWCAAYTPMSVPGDAFDRLEQEAPFAGAFAERDEPALDDAHRGLRVRVFRDQRLLADQTFWSVSGGAPGGVLTIQVSPVSSPPSDHLSPDAQP